MTIAQFKWRLEEKVGDFQTIDEALVARDCFANGLSVHLTHKKIEQMRKAAWN